MADITVRKEPARTPARPMDPFEWMRNLWSMEPFAPRMWPMRLETEEFMPAFDVKETKEGYLFKADLPGVKLEDVEITMTGNILTVKGSRQAEKEEKAETYFMYERSSGSFTRSFSLPEGTDADKVKAELKDGVLTLMLPKRPESQPKRISIK
jgi:HSP20 family protein